MKKFVLIPDSFKGTMSSAEICQIMERRIQNRYPDAEVISIPVADGGEGSVDCFLEAVRGEKIIIKTVNPLMEEADGFYGIIDDGKTAVVEMAACAGLPLIEDRKDPLNATTYGVGKLILDAAKRGVTKIVIGLGGSATNDGGCGAACAAGVKFYDNKGESFIPTGGSLSKIARIDMSGLDKSLSSVGFVTMCDIDNPLCGLTGAAHVFGPQKGASAEDVETIDAGLKHLSEIIARDLKKEVAQIPGSGAAGGMGAGMVAFFGSRLQMGIETVLDIVNFDNVIKDADMILTGEGKIDGQSLRGKVVIGVARRAKAAGVPVVAIVGDIGDNIEAAYDEGVAAVFSINRVAVDFKLAKPRAKSDLALTVDNLMHFCSNMKF